MLFFHVFAVWRRFGRSRRASRGQVTYSVQPQVMPIRIGYGTARTEKVSRCKTTCKLLSEVTKSLSNVPPLLLGFRFPAKSTVPSLLVPGAVCVVSLALPASTKLSWQLAIVALCI
jgi:hypothetical protein